MMRQLKIIGLALLMLVIIILIVVSFILFVNWIATLFTGQQIIDFFGTIFAICLWGIIIGGFMYGLYKSAESIIDNKLFKNNHNRLPPTI